MAAPTWVAAGTKAEKPSPATTLNVAPPAGHAAGDLLVITADAYGPKTITTPAGWTVMSGIPQTWGSHRMYLFYKLAASSSEATVTLTFSGSDYGDAQMYAFRGVNATTPIDAGAVFGASATTANVAVPALTTVTNDALMVYVGHEDGSTAWNTPPAGATERHESTAFIAKFVVATEVKATAGTEAADVYARAGSGSPAICAAFAVRPVAAPAAPVANFTGTPLTGTAPLNVAFTDTSTGTPTSWSWDFGDSATSTSQNPSHTYTSAGSYTVELDATNVGGTDNEAKVAYVVVDAPPAIEGFSVAFDDPPMEADPTWTRIDTLAGCHVQEYTIDRGRPTEFDKTDTGTAVVRLIDREGLFDPTNTSSPYNGLILPGKQAAIALQNPVSDEWFTLFRGFIESWHYRLDITRQYMELELQLVDGFAILARAILEVGEDGALPPFDDFDPEQAEALNELAAGNVLYGETTGTVKDRIDGILEDVNWPDPPMRDVFTGNVRVGPKAYGPGTSALDAIWDAVDAEFVGVANCWMSKEGVFVFRGRQARFRPEVAEYQINERTVGDPSGWELDTDVVPIAELEWSNGQDNLFNACSATPQWVGTGATIRQLNPGEPDNDDVAGQYVTNPASITAYGLRSITFDQLQTVEGIATGSNSMVETKKVATYYVENYAEPASRISRMVFKSRRPGNTNGTALWNHLCRCEISDLLTVQTAHPGGGGFLEEQFYVEGLHYTVRPGPPTFPIVELSLDVSPKAHYDTNPFDEDEDP